jgi:NADH-quinone oxidoreductase subunit N
LTPTLLAAFTAPSIDFHSFAPEIVVLGVLVAVLLVDLFTDDGSALAPSIASVGLLLALIPIITLATTDHEVSMFGGAYMVDNFALVLKALFLISGYLVVLLSMNYIGEGDYWEGEYYQLIIASVLGMMVMASARDLISIFIALELLSIPAYMLAAWKKNALKGNEAGIKYYLMGVFASAVMLYGMSLIYGITGSTLLADIASGLGTIEEASTPIVTLAIVFVLVGFGFKVSAVPFHAWAPDTYEGAPTPVTAFLAVASKAAGFVALMTLVFVAFRSRTDVFQPMMWVLSVLTMVVGNLIALRQTNVVRMLAYSGVAQAGYMLAPFAVYGTEGVASMALSSIITYLLIYMVMNIGAFAVVMAVARKTGSAELSAFSGLREYAPGLTLAMTIFLFSLAGIPPLGGWFAKFGIFQVLASSGSWWGYSLALVVGVNSVIALFYYARVAKAMWMEPVADGDLTPIKVPVSIATVLVITAVATLAIGVYPGLVTRFSDSTCLSSAPRGCEVDTAAP